MAADVLIVLGCLLAAVVLADRVAARLAGRLVARRIAVLAGIVPPPRVRLVTASVPFLAQLAAGRFGDVRLTFPPFTAGSVDIGGLDLRLTRVRAPLARPGSARTPVTPIAGRAAGTMTLSFSALERRLPAGLALTCHGGELRVGGSVLRVPVSGTLELVAEPRRVRVTPRVLGLPSLVGFALAVPALPPEMTIDSVQVTVRGLEVRMHGENVRLAGPVSSEYVTPSEPEAPAARLPGCGGTWRRREPGAS